MRILLADRSIDILSINETKLDDSIKSCEVQIPGYEFIRRDRNRQGGGVGFYIKNSINLTLLFVLTCIIVSRGDWLGNPANFKGTFYSWFALSRNKKIIRKPFTV